MAVRTTVDIPEPLHDQLRQRAENNGTSIRSLIVEAIEQAYSVAAKEKDGHRANDQSRRQTWPLVPNRQEPV